MGFPPVFTNAWDVTQPPDTQLANLLGQDLRNVRTDVMQRLSLLSGTFANRPTPETVNAVWGGAGFGLLYFSTDNSKIYQWNGAAWVDVTSSLVSTGYKLEGVNITPVTVANTIALSPLQGILIPANDIGVKQTFNFDCSGVLGDLGPGVSLAVYLYLDGVEIDYGLPLNMPLSTANNQFWALSGSFTCLTAGVAGTIAPLGLLWRSSPAGGGITNNGSALGAAPVVDTTSAHTLQLQVRWSAANASNTITQNVMTVTRFG